MILYTNGCPRCRILENNLKQEGFAFEKEDDVRKLIAKKIMSAPVLELDDGKMLTYDEALEFIQKRGA